MSNENKTGFHPSQVAAAALASVTAAVLGSTLGVAGTVLGAAIGSIVTTVAAEAYLRSLRRVQVRVTKDQGDKEEKPSRRVRWQLLAGVSVAAFVLGLLVITGVEWVRGSPLSGDGKTTIGGVLQPSDPIQKQSTTTTKTVPPSTVTVTPTPTSPETTTTTTPPPTSGTTSTGQSETGTATTDPVQSTASSQPSGTP
jgi:hypothetical protein